MQPAHRFCHSQLLIGYRTQNTPRYFTGRLTTRCSLLVSFSSILLSAGGRRLYRYRIFHHLLQWTEAPSHAGVRGMHVGVAWCLRSFFPVFLRLRCPLLTVTTQPSTLRAGSTGESFKGRKMKLQLFQNRCNSVKRANQKICEVADNCVLST